MKTQRNMCSFNDLIDMGLREQDETSVESLLEYSRRCHSRSALRVDHFNKKKKTAFNKKIK